MAEYDQNLKRQLTIVQHGDANRVSIDGRSLINFASNDYLGLTRDPQVVEAAVIATEKFGTGSGSSPLLSGHSELHQQFAEFVTSWKSATEQTTTELRTLLFPSGYAANLSVLGAMFSRDCSVFCDRRNHASIIDGIRLAKQKSNASVRYYRHCDLAHLESLLAATPVDAEKWVVSDSVFSMDGTIADTNSLQKICQHYCAGLIVDEAHATGVLGHQAAGCLSPLMPVKPPVIVVGTMSKALAASGGFAVSDSQTIDRILQNSRPLIYSTALPPASVAAALSAAKIARRESSRQQVLHRHIHQLHQSLDEQGWTTSGNRDAPLLSVIVGDAQCSLQIARHLRENGIFAPAIRPPTVRPLECRIRISPTATMLDSEIDQLVTTFAKIRKRLPAVQDPKSD